MRPTSIFLGFIGIATLPAASAQTGLNSLPEVEFAQLSQRDPNPLGERALSINPTRWKHGETEHYIYHFAHRYVATPISVAGRGCLALRRSRVQQRWCGRTA